jgi:hypothetical protein
LEGNEEEIMLGVGKFRFENEQITNWVNTGGNIEYRYEVRKTGISLLNQNEGLLSFTFHLEINPIGEIKFNGDCILFSTILQYLIEILKAKKESEIRKRNEAFVKTLNKLLLKGCLDHSKEISEREGFNLVGFETLYSNWGLDNISL